MSVLHHHHVVCVVVVLGVWTVPLGVAILLVVGNRVHHDHA